MAHTLNSARTAIESLWAKKAENLAYLDNKKIPTELYFWTIISFFAAQRFIFPAFTEYVCIIPLCATFFYFNKDSTKCNTFIFLALFWSVDQSSSNIPSLTPTALRYIIYCTAFVIILESTLKSKVASPLFIGIWTVIIAQYTFLTFLDFQHISYSQLFRDIQIFILITTLFCFPYNKKLKINLNILFVTMVAFLISENINFFFLSEYWSSVYFWGITRDYMNFDSTKFLIIFPSLYALLTKRFILALVLTFLTIPILLGYQTRYIFLSYIGVFILAFYFLSQRYNILTRFFIWIGIIAVSIPILTNIIFSEESIYRSLYFIQTIYNSGDVFVALQYMDPSRYAESKSFFQLPVYEILFGRGFGSGILDSDGSIVLANFLGAEQLYPPGYFYHFHDIWTEIGLRFGLLPLCIFVVWILFQRPKHSRQGTVIWLLTLVALYNAVYTSSGILMLFFLIYATKTFQTHPILQTTNPIKHT